MANSIEDLEALPDIDMLGDEGITLEGIQEEMIADYQEAYQMFTGEEIILYPAHPRRLEMNVIAGQIYQVYEFASYLFKQNFIRYMEDDVLRNWGGNLGFTDNNLRAAACTLEFGLNEPLGYPVEIPAGTRATAGDDVFFATDETCSIKEGETVVTVAASCTEKGSMGNGYVAGQINALADPVVNVSTVRNIDESSGGGDEYSGDGLREKIFLFPSTYSVAGTEDAYIYYTKLYSEDIISVNVITDKENATVEIYIMLEGGNVPDGAYCEKVLNYLLGLKKFPDTDKIAVYPPEVVPYRLEAAYYISSANKDTERSVKESVEEAAEAYIQKQYGSLGHDINPDIFKEYARVAGGKRTVVTSPVFTSLEANQVAICTGKNIVYGGLEDD